MARKAANLVSREYTGAIQVPANANRSYFFILVTGGTIGLSFGGGNGEIQMTSGQSYEPLVAPISSYEVTGTGTYVITEG